MRRTLAEILVEEKLLEAERVAAVERQAHRSGEPLVVAVVELERVNETDVRGALRRHLRAEVLDADTTTPEPEAVREVPHELARRRRVLPLNVDVPAQGPRTLAVAMADPTDRDAIAEVEICTGCRVVPLLSTLSAVDDGIARAYRDLVTAVMKRDGSPVEAPAHSRRVPFGGDLVVATADGIAAGVGTEPYHSVDDEAPLEMRLRALLDVLHEKGLVTPDEYSAQVRKLLKERE